jgi:hypothetical protein
MLSFLELPSEIKLHQRFNIGIQQTPDKKKKIKLEFAEKLEYYHRNNFVKNRQKTKIFLFLIE